MNKIIDFLKKRVWIIILIAGILFIPQSFNYQAKINMRVLVTGIGIDKTENGYEVTAQVIMPTPGSESGGSGARLDFISETGESISEGVQKIAYKIGKTAGLSHAGFVIVGENVLEENLVTLLDFFARDAKVNPSLMLLICEGNAKDTLKQTGKLELSVGVDLQKVFIYKQSSLNGLVMPIEEFINATFGISKSSIASGITIAPEGEENTSSKAQNESGGNEQEGSSQGSNQTQAKNARIKFYNEIYYFKDGKYIGKLDEEYQILGVFFTDKTANNGEFKISGVTGGILEDATVGVSFTDKKASTKVKFKNGKPTFTFNIKIKDIKITEMLNNDKPSVNLYNKMDKETMNVIKEKIKEEVQNFIISAFEQAKADGVDIFDVGEKMYQTKTKEWKKFYDEYGDNYLKNLDVKVNVEILNIN